MDVKKEHPVGNEPYRIKELVFKSTTKTHKKQVADPDPLHQAASK
jgi:hypothetical protein